MAPSLRRRQTDEHHATTARQCFNCASQPYGPTPLCRECLRMAIITAAAGGVSTETIHRLMAVMFP